MSDTIPPMRRRADLEKIALVTCRSELEKVKFLNGALIATLKDINDAACYASEQDTDSRAAILLRIGDIARAALANAEARS